MNKRQSAYSKRGAGCVSVGPLYGGKAGMLISIDRQTFFLEIIWHLFSCEGTLSQRAPVSRSTLVLENALKEVTQCV